MRDLVWMPIDQYRRDRRLVRGIQRGASSFSASTAMAAIDLTNRLVHLIQCTAQFAHDVVTPPARLRYNVPMLSLNQPRDFKEGVTNAAMLLKEGLNGNIRNLSAHGYRSGSMSDAIGSVLRQVPSTLLSPIIQASQATSNVLVGMRNQLTPEARKEDQDKWKNAGER